MSDQTNTQTVISLKSLGQDEFLWHNVIDITWNKDQKVNLVTQLMAHIRPFVRRWHNTVIPLTVYTKKERHSPCIQDNTLP